ncbi:MAG TPA: pitrilysin family protein, partial [Bacteroidota bacterium]|nr:pitrilysin family protein [Bacteroidota bacterium]
MKNYRVEVSMKSISLEKNSFVSFPIMMMLIILSIVYSGLSFGQNPDRKKPPELGPPPSLILPPIQRLKLSNGLPVILMEKHNVPLVQMELVVKTGSITESPEKIGLASFAASMMEEGAGSRNALELSDAIDYLGAGISTYAGQHTSGVVLHCALSKLDSALALFGDIAMRPTFPSDEVERGRKERLTMLMQWHDEPRQIASVLFNRTLFGKIHPYGIPSIGDEKSLRAFRVDDLKKFHETYFHPNNASLIVVGDVTSEVILPKLETVFGKLKRVDIPKISLPPVEQVQKRQIYLVNKPGAAQSEIRIGRIGVQRLTED